MVLISGYSGVGKSSVVNELHKVLVRRAGSSRQASSTNTNAIFLFDAGGGLQRLVRPLLGKSEIELGCWRDALRERLPKWTPRCGPPPADGHVGEQPPVSDLPHKTPNGDLAGLPAIIGVFARPEHPLALFLDDRSGSMLQPWI